MQKIKLHFIGLSICRAEGDIKMAIENLAEVSAYLDTNKDLPEVKGYIGGFITTDRVNNFLEGEDGKKLLQPKLDVYHNKSLESWKTNNLDKIYKDRFIIENPGADPKDIKYQELENRFNLAEQGRLKETLTNKALKLAQEKKLPIELIDFVIGSDESSTIKNIDMLSAIFLTHDEALKTELLKGNTYVPPTGNKTPITVTKEDFDKMTYQNRIKLLSENPELYKELNK